MRGATKNTLRDFFGRITSSFFGSALKLLAKPRSSQKPLILDPVILLPVSFLQLFLDKYSVSGTTAYHLEHPTRLHHFAHPLFCVGTLATLTVLIDPRSGFYDSTILVELR